MRKKMRYSMADFICDAFVAMGGLFLILGLASVIRYASATGFIVLLGTFFVVLSYFIRMAVKKGCEPSSVELITMNIKDNAISITCAFYNVFIMAVIIIVLISKLSSPTNEEVSSGYLISCSLCLLSSMVLCITPNYFARKENIRILSHLSAAIETIEPKGYLQFSYEGDNLKSNIYEFVKGDFAPVFINTLLSGKDFAKLIKCGCLSDIDGTMTEIFVDGYKSNLGLSSECFHQGGLQVSLPEFKRLCKDYDIVVNWQANETA